MILALALPLILLLSGGSGVASRLRLEHSGVTATGHVVRLQGRPGRHGTSYYPVVQFMTEDNGEITFTGSAGSRPPAFQVNEEVAVLYDPDNPQTAYIKTFTQFWAAPLVPFLAGLLIAAVPGGKLMVDARRRSRARWLKENGRHISTQFQSVECVTNIRVGRRNPYRIVSRWQDPATGQHYVFQSFNLWQDPTLLIGNRAIDVYIESGNPDNYWVDTDFLGGAAS